MASPNIISAAGAAHAEGRAARWAAVATPSTITSQKQREEAKKRRKGAEKFQTRLNGPKAKEAHQIECTPAP
ncbi:hypothetical protein EVAR_25976_1 [Eumeta japonica]|uniref:Uncharacterized protein n=1 Tax=Eumeta variegata TaxID=151549 RepID=A0A4C1V316_EUMVA|nr:hypothetical protein EVAR_25976_1 [Eumeta japonica]